MTCRVCRDTGWVGWVTNGERAVCGWCNAEPKAQAGQSRIAKLATEFKREVAVSEKPNPSRAWQEINDTLDRVEVPGGWLYRAVAWDEDGTHPAVAITFVPRAPSARYDR